MEETNFLKISWIFVHVWKRNKFWFVKFFFYYFVGEFVIKLSIKFDFLNRVKEKNYFKWINTVFRKYSILNIFLLLLFLFNNRMGHVRIISFTEWRKIFSIGSLITESISWYPSCILYTSLVCINNLIWMCN